MKLLLADYPLSGIVGHYWIDSTRRMRIEQYHGKVGLVDLKHNLTAMASDPCWAPDFNGLVDFTTAELDLSSNDILRLALMYRQDRLRSSGWLVFVATNSTVFGIVRMLGYWSRNTDRMRIFKSRSEAEIWLERNRYHVPPTMDAGENVVDLGIRNVI